MTCETLNRQDSTKQKNDFDSGKRSVGATRIDSLACEAFDNAINRVSSDSLYIHIDNS